jgi:glucose-1-phosphate cytidylyltransferase
MRALILAGGLGTRFSEETHDKPKPMIKIGPYTLIEHIMDIYAMSGVTSFIVATGYKGHVVNEYFEGYKKYQIECIETGETTQTGGRIKQVLDSITDEIIFVTYGDGLGNVSVSRSLSFHLSHGKLATVTAVRPPARFGRLSLSEGKVVKFGEKMQSEEGWINGGFFVLNREISKYISNDAEPFEVNPLNKITSDGQLMAFEHHGFWAPVDTLREKIELEKLWNSSTAPWTILD